MEIKDTLLMPKTDFKMRGNLAVNEIAQRELWEEMDIYRMMVDRNDGKPNFVLHDGPPYANGNIHLGHAFQKILKDFINRYKSMNGFRVEFIPGWDTHGLPIETSVTNSGVNRKELSIAEFRKLCLSYAKEQVETQKTDFMKLNIIGDWSNPYITYTNDYEARQIKVFAGMVKKGLIFKGFKPIYWSPSSESALAEAEIEYKDKTDDSVYVFFNVLKGNEFIKENDRLLIWTTTPWTLPGNLGVAMSERFNYSRVEYEDNVYIIATDLVDSLVSKFGWEGYSVISSFSGKECIGVTYSHPFMNLVGKMVVGYHVTLDAGTGLVHIAPSYGVDDYNIGREYDLGMVNGVDDFGVLNSESGKYEGLFYEKANDNIICDLDKEGFLVFKEQITHSYPHDWRTKKPIIFRATPQWFCDIDIIKDDLLDQIENKIEFHTVWGKTRMYNMIKDREDWCISRQRVWGVPIPIFYNEDKSEIVDYDVMLHISELFGKHGSDIWYEWDAKDLLPEGYNNELSPNGKFTKETDTMDVWFDSGSSFAAVLLERGLKFPADIYLEGSDQYRGWFNSSLICSVATEGVSPYNKLLSTGMVLDGKGYKMSKSIGNIVDPLKIIKKEGSDILRLWTASVDFREDVRYSDEILLQVKESYRKIRNTYRFMLGNINGFDEDRDSIDYTNMSNYNKYMMIKLSELIRDVLNSYDNYNFQEVVKLIVNYVTNELSTFYLDFTKDILYIKGKKSQERLEIQTVMYNILYSLIRLLAPIIPYTSEEVYLKMFDKTSVHLEDMPEVKDYEDSFDILNLFNDYFEIKDDVYKALEESREEHIIGKSMESIVRLNLGSKYDKLMSELGNDLKLLLIVSGVEFTDDNIKEYDNVGVEIIKHDGIMCDRCWAYFGETEITGEVCKSCYDIMKSMDL